VIDVVESSDNQEESPDVDYDEFDSLHITQKDYGGSMKMKKTEETP